jgi:hypothetical protein
MCLYQPVDKSSEIMTKYVFLTGPHSAFTREMEEYPQWYVSVAEELDEEPEHHYKVNSFEKALRLAVSICNDRNLELVNNCSPE